MTATWRAMRRRAAAADERGAALLFVLLIMALLIALITGFLAVVQSEARQGGFARNTTRAFEVADAGIDEMVGRMEAALPYRLQCTQNESFQISLAPSPTNIVCIQKTKAVGPGVERHVVLSRATVAGAPRRVLASIVDIMIDVPAKAVVGDKIFSSGSANILSGDVYSQSSIDINKDLPPSNQVYAGFWIKDRPPGPVQLWVSKYTLTSSPDCSYQPDPRPATGCTINNAVPANWWPRQRMAVWRSSPRGQLIDSSPDGYTFDNLKYKVFTDPLLDPNGVLVPVTRLYVIYEDWFNMYWQCTEDGCSKINRPGTDDLVDEPRRGAVPPFPNIDPMMANCDVCYPDGATLSSVTIGTAEEPQLVVFGTLGGPPVTAHMDGRVLIYGTVVVNGNLMINGNFDIYGVLIVKGTITVGNGTANVYGGMLADDAVTLNGDINIHAGETPAYPVTGRAKALVEAWWER